MSQIRKIVYAVLVLLVLIAGSGAAAQDASDWTAWLYNQAAGTFTQVSSTGETLQKIDVPHSPGYEWYSFYALVSPNDRTVAYGEASGGDVSGFNGAIILYDINTEQILTTYPLNPSSPEVGVSMELFNLATQSMAYDASGDRLVFGYPFRFDANNPDVYQWEIVAMDLNEDAPAPMYVLDSTLAAAQLGTQPTALYAIVDLEYRDMTVEFTLQPVFFGQGLSAVTAVWDTQTGELNIVDNSDLSISDTADDVSIAMLPAPGQLPDDLVMGGASYNGVALVDTVTGDQQTLFQHEEGELLLARFVQNHERIAVFSIAPGESVPQLLILDLEGNLVQFFDNIPVGDLWLTPDGFLYVDQGSQSLVSVSLRNNGERTTLVDGMNNFYSISVVLTEG